MFAWVNMPIIVTSKVIWSTMLSSPCLFECWNAMTGFFFVFFSTHGVPGTSWVWKQVQPTAHRFHGVRSWCMTNGRGARLDFLVKLFLTCGEKRKVRELAHDLPSYFTLHPQNNDLEPCTRNSLIAVSPFELEDMQTLCRWICYYRQKCCYKHIYLCDCKSVAWLGWIDANVFVGWKTYSSHLHLSPSK